MSLLWAASTAANVTNASFKSSTGPLPATLLACEPSEGKSMETAAVLVSCLRKLRATLYVLLYSVYNNVSNIVQTE